MAGYNSCWGATLPRWEVGRGGMAGPPPAAYPHYTTALACESMCDVIPCALYNRYDKLRTMTDLDHADAGLTQATDALIAGANRLVDCIDPGDYLTTAEFAYLSNLCMRTVYRFIADGKVSTVQFNPYGRHLIPKTELARYLVGKVRTGGGK